MNQHRPGDGSVSVSEELKSISSAFAVLFNQRTKEKHYIFEKKSVIGRCATAVLCVFDSRISRRHCVIEKTEDNKFTICDISNSGTFVNDKKLIKNQPEEINHRDVIKLADIETYTYMFVMNKEHPEVKNIVKRYSLLTDQMTDLNETQSLEKDSMDKELNLVEREMSRLKEELNQQLKTREDELEKERCKVSEESAHNKEQAEKAMLMLKEMTEDKDRIIKEYEQKITDVTKKVEEIQNTKSEMGKRHQIEREELENRCKADIEDLKKKLEQSETKHQQYEELKARLEETKSILEESELEQQRLFEAKVEAEIKLESKIIDLTNVRKDKEDEVKELEKKLKEKQEEEEKVKKVIEGLEDDLMCSVCAEIYVEPTALNCGHVFCKLCIGEWSKKKKICPMCRAKISTTIRLFNMDSVIQRNVDIMSEEVRTRREALISERQNGKSAVPQKKRCKKRHREVSSPQDLSPRRRVIPNVVLHRLQPHHESEGDDPFQMGWVPTQHMVTPRMSSPVRIAAIDLTNTPTTSTVNRSRSHTATSSDVNTTIDLTDI